MQRSNRARIFKQYSCNWEFPYTLKFELIVRIMPNIGPKKLLHSKWTRTEPERKEKHFIVVDVEYDDEGRVMQCVVEAVINHNQYPIDWRQLNDRSVWQAGWV